ncbi:MAG: hypothetical protein KC931_19910, partial [Candidatus Omnitrophica bacterium]|nr:hypothetical protein [Candidatus Omnitrophota bacterium]
MRTFKALLWKEFQTLKYVWIAGVVLFYGIGFWPVFVRSGAFGSYPSQSVGGITLCFGAVYCVILVIALLCQDFQKPLEFFWRSRPVSLVRLLSVKYFVGSLTVFFISFVPLAFALLVDGRPTPTPPDYKLLSQPASFEVHILLYHTFTLMLVFSVCFLIAALVRKAVETALLSFAAILAIYFFPVVFPPLEHLSVINLINSWEDSVGLFRSQVLNIDYSHNEFAMLDRHFRLGPMVLAFDPQWLVFILSMILFSALAVG